MKDENCGDFFPLFPSFALLLSVCVMEAEKGQPPAVTHSSVFMALPPHPLPEPPPWAPASPAHPLGSCFPCSWPPPAALLGCSLGPGGLEPSPSPSLHHGCPSQAQHCVLALVSPSATDKQDPGRPGEVRRLQASHSRWKGDCEVGTMG